jgi:two-component sensor histidine kinase
MQSLKAIQLHEKSLKDANLELNMKNKLVQNQNNEMKVMMREIHHRVKNNLQIITSILRLQDENNKSKNKDSFASAINRINAMALIHEKMYQAESLSQFDIKKYVQTLATEIIENYSSVQKPKLALKISIDKIHAKQIVALALLLNELMNNSIKHAFAQQNAPTIFIALENTENSQQFKLLYSDNGSWNDVNNKRKFGSEIIDAMTAQLDGNFTLAKSANGSCYTFCFSKIKEVSSTN